MTIDFGTDIRLDPVTEDADDLMSEISGVPLVAQCVRHRLLTDSVQGPDGADHGFDIRQLLTLPASELQRLQPSVVAAVRKDPRVQSCTVVLTEGAPGPLRTVTVDVKAKTALGPFNLVFLLSSKTTGAAVELLVSQ